MGAGKEMFELKVGNECKTTLWKRAGGQPGRHLTITRAVTSGNGRRQEQSFNAARHSPAMIQTQAEGCEPLF